MSADPVAVQALLDEGANVNSCRNWAGKLPLHIWISEHPEAMAYPELYFPVLERLLDATEDISLPRDPIVKLTLLGGHKNKRFDQVVWEQKLNLLLNHPHHYIDINAHRDTGMTLLLDFITCTKLPGLDHVEGLKMLRKQGADIMAHDCECKGIIWYAASNHSLCDQDLLDIIRFYIDCYPSQAVQTVLNRAKDTGGKTALMNMCGKGYVKCVLFALEQGVNVNDSDINGRTALDYPVENGNYHRLRALHRIWMFLGRLPRASDMVTDDIIYRTEFTDQSEVCEDLEHSSKRMKESYFTYPHLITALVAADAKTGKQLGTRTEPPEVKSKEAMLVKELDDPSEWEIENRL